IDWIIDGMNCDIMFFNGEAITVEPPMIVELKIVDTPPNFKGDSQGGKKPATLESGAVVQIPFHILEGDVIRVDTRTGEYIEKVK
ncbi:MAG: elongation factor P, partial [Arcobacteraceae bacterium]